MINYAELVAEIKLYMPTFVFLVVSIAMGVLLNYFLYRTVKQRLNHQRVISVFLQQMKGPLYLIFPLFFIIMATSLLDLSRVTVIIELTVRLLLIISISWCIIKLINYSDVWIAAKYRNDYNRIAAKFYLLKKLMIIAVVIISVSLFLMNFEKVREVGQGILLSAGVVSGIILFAAQGVFGNIISGFQLTFSRPINIGDELVIDDQFGTVEEITLTNVIFKTWDLRRLIVPLNYLIEKPYENWTYPNRELIGIVFLYVNYDMNVDKLRNALNSILEATPLWDKKTNKIEVTESTEKGMQLRILASARNAKDVWDLRCEVREKMIQFIQENFPSSLPKVVADIRLSESVLR